MLFTEFHFIFIFVPLTLLAFELVPSLTSKLVVLTLASLVFYAGWDPKFLPVLVISLAANFWLSRELEKAKSRAVLAAAIVINLLPIAYFKYSGLFVGVVTSEIPRGFFGEKLGSLLPIGISFYTFQQIAYLVDIYSGKFKAVDGLRFVFCTTFFPHLIAGPIVQFKELIPQLGQPVDRSVRFLEGVLYFAVGFAKKFFIADSFASFSDPIYASTGSMHFERSAIAMLGYTFQIYFDFSGYSDMALGLARLFGWQLPWNFNSPYKAFSIGDFWRRWHMTLSGFLRDYVYIGLGGNRGGAARRYANLLSTMLIGGLWHGAAWTFVAWGGLHGFALVIDAAWRRHLGRSVGWAGGPLTFLTVALLWVMFRATSFSSARDIYAGFFTFGSFAEWKFWVLAAVGFVLIALPNSHDIVASVSHRWLSRLTLDVPGLGRRLGIFSAVSWAALTITAFAFYAWGIDRLVYRYMKPGYELGLSRHDSGDFRSALWSKYLVSAPGHRLAIAGSSFANGMGAFAFEVGGLPWVSESLGIGGNGLLNAARLTAQLSTAKAVDVIVLALSPLNFGDTLESGPFPGQCLDGLEGVIYKIQPEYWGQCGARALQSADIAKLAFLPFSNDGYQFRHFVRLITSPEARSSQAPLRLELTPSAVEMRLADFKARLARVGESSQTVSNPTNGADSKFHWQARNIIASLSEAGAGYAYLAAMKTVAVSNGVRLIAYETPTVSHAAMPTIFPEGFFEAYQGALRAALAKLEIPYLDLSGLLPWDGSTMMDFVHATRQNRPLVHEIVIDWVFRPAKLEASGLLPSSAFDKTWSGYE